MAKSPRCAETTHCSKGPLRLNVLHIRSVDTVAGIWDLNSMLEEMRNLKYFLNHQCVHTPFVSCEAMSFTFNTIIQISEGW